MTYLVDVQSLYSSWLKDLIANKVVRITSENIIKGEVPKDEHYIPIVHAQSATNEYEVSIRYDYPSWIVYSNVGQSLGIRFYKCTK